MTEKQRWLLQDLETWRKKEMVRIGQYGPRRKAKEPLEVRQARRTSARAALVIQKWDIIKDKPWKKQRDDIGRRVESVKRIILFEKIADALEAVRSLR